MQDIFFGAVKNGKKNIAEIFWNNNAKLKTPGGRKYIFTEAVRLEDLDASKYCFKN